MRTSHRSNPLANKSQKAVSEHIPTVESENLPFARLSATKINDESSGSQIKPKEMKKCITLTFLLAIPIDV